jgi:hypothetical protein
MLVNDPDNFGWSLSKTGHSKTGVPVLRPSKNTKKRHFSERDMLTPYLIRCRLMCWLTPMAVLFKSYR